MNTHKFYQEITFKLKNYYNRQNQFKWYYKLLVKI